MENVNGITAAFKTSDGKVFEDLEEAKKHQLTLNASEETTDKIKDLLNQVLLLSDQLPSSYVSETIKDILEIEFGEESEENVEYSDYSYVSY